MQEAQKRQLCLKEVKCLYELLGKGSKSEAVSTLKRVINTEELKFADDDLVYGPHSYGKLRELQEKAGGKMLDDIEKPTELEWLTFSKYEMEKAVNRGSTIHFDLTYMKDVEGILNNTGKYKDTITAGELRYIRDNWHRFAENVKFYYYEMEVIPPWE